MQSALLLTGLERSIQNTRALVEKIVGVFQIARLGVKRIADFFFWYRNDTGSTLNVSHFGVAN